MKLGLIGALGAMTAVLAAGAPPRYLDVIDAATHERPMNQATRSYRPKASRYMPHIGAKERARHAGKSDGPMHGLPPLFRKVAS